MIDIKKVKNTLQIIKSEDKYPKIIDYLESIVNNYDESFKRIGFKLSEEETYKKYNDYIRTLIDDSKSLEFARDVINGNEDLRNKLGEENFKELEKFITLTNEQFLTPNTQEFIGMLSLLTPYLLARKLASVRNITSNFVLFSLGATGKTVFSRYYISNFHNAVADYMRTFIARRSRERAKEKLYAFLAMMRPIISSFGEDTNKTVFENSDKFVDLLEEYLYRYLSEYCEELDAEDVIKSTSLNARFKIVENPVNSIAVADGLSPEKFKEAVRELYTKGFISRSIISVTDDLIVVYNKPETVSGVIRGMSHKEKVPMAITIFTKNPDAPTFAWTAKVYELLGMAIEKRGLLLPVQRLGFDEFFDAELLNVYDRFYDNYHGLVAFENFLPYFESILDGKLDTSKLEDVKRIYGLSEEGRELIDQIDKAFKEFISRYGELDENNNFKFKSDDWKEIYSDSIDYLKSELEKIKKDPFTWFYSKYKKYMIKNGDIKSNDILGAFFHRMFNADSMKFSELFTRLGAQYIIGKNLFKEVKIPQENIEEQLLKKIGEAEKRGDWDEVERLQQELEKRRQNSKNKIKEKTKDGELYNPDAGLIADLRTMLDAYQTKVIRRTLQIIDEWNRKGIPENIIKIIPAENEEISEFLYSLAKGENKYGLSIRTHHNVIKRVNHFNLIYVKDSNIIPTARFAQGVSVVFDQFMMMILGLDDLYSKGIISKDTRNLGIFKLSYSIFGLESPITQAIFDVIGLSG